MEAARRALSRSRSGVANGWYQAEREPAAIARLAQQVVARGYRALKLDPFGAATAELPAPDHPPQVAIDDGCFGLPDRPGLGVGLNHEACAAHPRTGGRPEAVREGMGAKGPHDLTAGPSWSR